MCLVGCCGARAIEAGQGTKMTQFFSVVLGGLFGGQGRERGLKKAQNVSQEWDGNADKSGNGNKDESRNGNED